MCGRVICLQALFPGEKLMDLPETQQGLQRKLDKNLHNSIPLGVGIDVVLPNKSRQDDLLFVQQLLRRLCGANGGDRESWTYLIWQVRTTQHSKRRTPSLLFLVNMPLPNDCASRMQFSHNHCTVLAHSACRSCLHLKRCQAVNCSNYGVTLLSGSIHCQSLRQATAPLFMEPMWSSESSAKQTMNEPCFTLQAITTNSFCILQVYVFIDDGPLPPSKGLMDVPGADLSPLRNVIRSEGFKQVDSLMMVMDFKTFDSAENVSCAKKYSA
jgi:hypothetical protein